MAAWLENPACQLQAVEQRRSTENPEKSYNINLCRSSKIAARYSHESLPLLSNALILSQNPLYSLKRDIFSPVACSPVILDPKQDSFSTTSRIYLASSLISLTIVSNHAQHSSKTLHQTSLEYFLLKSFLPQILPEHPNKPCLQAPDDHLILQIPPDSSPSGIFIPNPCGNFSVHFLLFFSNQKPKKKPFKTTSKLPKNPKKSLLNLCGIFAVSALTRSVVAASATLTFSKVAVGALLTFRIWILEPELVFRINLTNTKKKKSLPEMECGPQGLTPRSCLDLIGSSGSHLRLGPSHFLNWYAQLSVLMCQSTRIFLFFQTNWICWVNATAQMNNTHHAKFDVKKFQVM
ncbi:hypothetical protein VP01_889g2 [Puccinia sorghi]|uniref:Uncharacterized protein n=1 Tax=Puccinia sorghi TaxID=27349 RepID=A0A0L6U8V0_9BASI|nr:hypothetical protein VP01_889g2 [Puccinia sorghi]